MGLSYDTLRYFSHDADMRNDIKVKALRRKFGLKGYAVWCFILETLTDREDFEIDYTPVEIELMAADFDVEVEELKEIVEYCVKVNLLQLEDNRLFSYRHKERFEKTISERQKKSEAGKLGMLKRWGNRNNNTEIADDNSVITDGQNVITQDSKLDKNRLDEIREEKKVIRYPYQDIADLWNEICVSLPKLQKLNDNRRQKIKCRCDEWGKTAEVWMKIAEELFRRVQASDFLKGGTGWTANFDWVFANSSNYIKVLEGNYDNNRGAKAKTADKGMTLGVGEFIDKDGRRTYGSGKVTIPPTAPPRPSESYCWDEASKNWMNL